LAPLWHHFKCRRARKASTEAAAAGDDEIRPEHLVLGLLALLELEAGAGVLGQV
jgi:hypothetical protein